MSEENNNKELLELQEEIKSLKKIIYCLGGDFDESESGNSIDFAKIFKTLWSHKRLYVKVLALTFVLAAIIAISIPNYYQCEVKLSPELSGSKSNNSLASIASSFGINLGGAVGNATEALFPTLYPDLMNSVDFKTSLFTVPVTIEGDKDAGEKDRTMSYYDYLKNEQKVSWISAVLSSPSELIGWVKSLFISVPESDEGKIDPSRLTMDQYEIVKTLDDQIVCDVDKKTMMITISVTDQDPVICCAMADSVKVHLQDFITQYRTKKARIDYAYNQKLLGEAKVRYEQSRKRYAGYSDGNQRVFLQSVLSQKDALETEMQLQRSAYQQIASQLLAAEAKVQEDTPAFTTLQSATVPLEKAGPKRAMMCLVIVFLAFLGTTVWILYKEDELRSLLRHSQKSYLFR